MDVLGQFLDERARDQPQKAPEWLALQQPPERRLLAFDRWLKEQLSARLNWDWAGAQREKRIEQCRAHLEKMVLELWRRGWLLEGKALAARITELLDAVAKYQRAGKVADFWPYFSACVSRYVGANAEEIQAQAMNAGGQMAGILGALGVRKSDGTTLPELVAKRREEVSEAKQETLRKKVARERAKNKAQESTLPLF